MRAAAGWELGGRRQELTATGDAGPLVRMATGDAGPRVRSAAGDAGPHSAAGMEGPRRGGEPEAADSVEKGAAEEACGRGGAQDGRLYFEGRRQRKLVAWRRPAAEGARA